MGHYSKIDLDRFLNGDMNVIRISLCRRHLLHCAECRRALEELRSDNELSRDIRLAVERKQQAESICKRNEDKTITRLKKLLE